MYFPPNPSLLLNFMSLAHVWTFFSSFLLFFSKKSIPGRWGFSILTCSCQTMFQQLIWWLTIRCILFWFRPYLGDWSNYPITTPECTKYLKERSSHNKKESQSSSVYTIWHRLSKAIIWTPWQDPSIKIDNLVKVISHGYPSKAVTCNQSLLPSTNPSWQSGTSVVHGGDVGAKQAPHTSLPITMCWIWVRIGVV